MLEKPPRLTAAFLCAVFAIVGWYEAATLAGFIAALVGSMALLLIILACFYVADWLSFKILLRYRGYQDAKTMTGQARILEQLRQLSDIQAQVILAERVHLVVTPGHGGPERSFNMGNGRFIKAELVEFFFENSQGDYLCPIGVFSDSAARDNARLMTDRLIGLGFAERANGNESAKWLGPDERDEAFASWGMNYTETK